jgi:ribosomal protein S18 acetylase RimI-like enzyme
MLGKIQRELIGGIPLNRFIQRYENLLNTDGQIVKKDLSPNSRGAEIYIAASQEQIIGFMFLNLYFWDILAPQICIKTEMCNSRKIFSLKPFLKLEKLICKPKFAAEIFILWIAPDYRNIGVGRNMFLKALRAMNKFLTKGDVAFLTVRSGLSKRNSKGLFRFLLDLEKKANGKNSTGEVIISGVQVEKDYILACTGIDYNSIPVHPNARAIEILSKHAGFHFLGYTSKTSAIYSKIW